MKLSHAHGATQDGLVMVERSDKAEDIKKRWQEYTEELYKKDLHDPDNHDGVITDLEPDILECEVKWALESITMNKASGGDGIPVVIYGCESWTVKKAEEVGVGEKGCLIVISIMIH